MVRWLVISDFSFSVLEVMLLTEVRGVFTTEENDSKYPLQNNNCNFFRINFCVIKNNYKKFYDINLNISNAFEDTSKIR